jgi:hypothetical protein
MRRRLLIPSAWLIHAAAWLVPIEREGVRLPEGLPGWQAFRFATGAYNGTSHDPWYSALLPTLSAVTTILFIFGSPWVALRGSRSTRRASAWAAAAAFIVNAQWYLFWDPRSDLRTGYFLWWFSFVLLAAGLFELTGPHRADESEGRRGRLTR